MFGRTDFVEKKVKQKSDGNDKMMDFKVNVVYKEQQVINGLWKKSNDKTISKDIEELSKRYHKVVSLPGKKVFPYFVLSKNYDEKSKDFEMFIGSTIKKESLDSFILPAGEYAKITIRPKFGFWWGISIGEAKRYFYTKWIWENPYEALNMEYEYHTEKSVEKRPTIDIIFAIKKK